MASLILAVRFLTIVPVPGREATGPRALGGAAWWFPVVGAALGGALVVADRLLGLVFPPLLSALLVLSCWKVATGGIHLDGLADCLDGVGGRDAEHRLAIMRDSRIGVFGAVGLILYFLIALVALAELPPALRWRTLLLAPVVGRLSPLLAGARFSPATPDHGAGGSFILALPAWSGPAHLVWVAGLSALLFHAWGCLIVGAALGVVLLWSRLLSWRFGGLTGDALGSGVEMSELTVLLVAVALARQGAL